MRLPERKNDFDRLPPRIVTESGHCRPPLGDADGKMSEVCRSEKIRKILRYGANGANSYESVCFNQASSDSRQSTRTAYNVHSTSRRGEIFALA